MHVFALCVYVILLLILHTLVVELHFLCRRLFSHCFKVMSCLCECLTGGMNVDSNLACFVSRKKKEKNTSQFLKYESHVKPEGRANKNCV